MGKPVGTKCTVAGGRGGNGGRTASPVGFLFPGDESGLELDSGDGGDGIP